MEDDDLSPAERERMRRFDEWLRVSRGVLAKRAVPLVLAFCVLAALFAAAPVRRGRGRNRGGGRGLLREKGRERRTAGDEHTEEIFHRNGEDAVAEELRFAAVKMKDRAVSREPPADAVVVGVEAAAGWGDSRATPDGKPGFEDLERDGNASRFRCRA